MMNHHLLKSWLSGAAGAALIATAAVAQGSGGSMQPPQDRSAAPSQSQPSQQDDQATPGSRQQQKSAAPSGSRNAQSGEKSSDRQKAQDSRMQDRDKAARDKGGKSDRDQAQRERSRDDAKPSARTTGQDSKQQSRDSARDSGTQNRDSARGATTRDQAAQPAREGSRGTAKLTEQQSARVSQSIARLDVDPVRNVNFSVAVGTTVPRSLRLHAVPPTIVEIYPQYRGYEFAIVEEEIVIIQPRTRRIVAVMPYSGGGSAKAAKANTRKSIRLSDRDRDTIRRTVVTRQTTGVAVPQAGIVVGETLPGTVVIERFPDTVYRQVPAVRSYRYIVRDDDVYLVDPRERRVIEIIE